MDPCSFVRILVGNFSLKFPLSKTKSSTCSYFCKIKLNNFPHQVATIPIIQSHSQQQQQQANNSSSQKPLAACFSLNKSQIDRIISTTGSSSYKVSIQVYTSSNATCGLGSRKLLGKFSVPLDLRKAESKPCIVHNGWIDLGQQNKNGSSSSESTQLCLTVRTEPDPRFVFQFGCEPECSPQVFQVQGSVKQAVFTCKFGFRNTSDRNLGGSRSLFSSSSLSDSKNSRNWLSSLRKRTEKDQSSKERKGWSITIHNLTGSPVAMASMVTPFVPSPGFDRVRPGCGTWKPWGRLEAWRETDSLGYRFDLFHDDAAETSTVAGSTVSTKHGGKFTMDMTTNVGTTPSISLSKCVVILLSFTPPVTCSARFLSLILATSFCNPRLSTENLGAVEYRSVWLLCPLLVVFLKKKTPSISPQSSYDFGSGSGSRSGSRPGSGSGSEFGFGVSVSPQSVYRGGFVMSSTVEGTGKSSKPEVEVGVHHVTCTEDAAAMDLSMDACLSFSQKLRKELRQQTQSFVV